MTFAGANLGRANNAVIGSAMLRDAILRAKGYPVPAQPRSRPKRRLFTMPACQTIFRIQREVAAFYEVDLADMTSSSRRSELVRARQTAMFLARMIAKRSFPNIGRHFGNRDHTTVLYAIKRVKQRANADPAYQADVEYLRGKVSA